MDAVLISYPALALQIQDELIGRFRRDICAKLGIKDISPLQTFDRKSPVFDERSSEIHALSTSTKHSESEAASKQKIVIPNHPQGMFSDSYFFPEHIIFFAI